MQNKLVVVAKKFNEGGFAGKCHTAKMKNCADPDESAFLGAV